MLAEFLPILILIAVASIVCTIMVVGSWVLGPKKTASFKESPYECGVEPFGSARERFPIKFYLTAILFVLFDIEVVFLWSWLSVFKGASLDFQIFSGAAVGVYMILWIIGDWYAISVGAIEWDEGTSLAPEKLVSGGTAVIKPVSSEVVAPGGVN